MKILSFGEIIWDIYSDKKCIGGAPLNFAAHAAHEGASSYLLSSVGNDELGCEAMELLNKFGISADHVSINKDFETGKCIVSLDNKGVPNFEVKENVAYDYISLKNADREFFDIIAFGTLALRNEHSFKTLKALLDNKNFGKVYCDINLRSPFYTRETVSFCLKNANILKLSDNELDYVLDHFFTIRYENLVQNLHLLCSTYPDLEEIIVTYGEKGAYAFSTTEDKIFYAPAKEVSVVSTVGAGDSFGAAFIVSRLKGRNIEESLKRATEVSAKVVSIEEAIPLDYMDSKLDILFLGTCACDFSPKLENELKDKFDYDARRSSSILIDGEILVDCGIHTLDSLRIAGINYDKISAIVITHLHDDHFNMEHIKAIARAKDKPLRLYVRSDANIDTSCDLEIVRMDLYKPCRIDDCCTVTGLEANHDKSSCPQHLMIERKGKRLFYGCDGAWLINDTYYALNESKLDLAIFDCTMGDYLGDYRIGEHNSIPMLRAMLPSLRNVKAITDKTKVYFSHLAPSLHRSHFETEKLAYEMGALVAYDGLHIKI